MVREEAVHDWIEDARRELQLDLEGLTVYTEAATGSYRTTAPLAAVAGARNVKAYATDSPYGTRADAIAATKKLAETADVDGIIDYPERKSKQDVNEADVVLNNGFVRPIDAEMIDWMKPTASVSLMYEPWEFRRADVDISACFRNGIPVLGTNEADDRIRTYEYIGELLIKLAHEANVSVLGSEILVVGSSELTLGAIDPLDRIGAKVVLVDPTRDGVTGPDDGKDASNATGIDQDQLADADALVVLEHSLDEEIIGPRGLVTVEELVSSNVGLPVIHVCGSVDAQSLNESVLETYPDEPAAAGHMSYTVGELGPEPIIRLQAGGLKVGAALTRARRAGASVQEAIEEVAAMDVASNFSEATKRDLL